MVDQRLNYEHLNNLIVKISRECQVKEVSRDGKNHVIDRRLLLTSKPQHNV